MAVRYQMTMNRQQRHTRSQIGTKSMKLSRMVDRTGKTSCQYLTAGFSAALGTYGTTCWVK